MAPLLTGPPLAVVRSSPIPLTITPDELPEVNAFLPEKLVLGNKKHRR